MSPAALPVLALLSTLLGTPPQAAPTPAAPSPAAQPADPGSCTGTLSGAATARFTCTATAQIVGPALVVTISVDEPVAGLRSLKPATITLPMPVQAGTFSGAALTSADSRVETAAGVAYAAGAGRGEVTLTVEQAERYRQLPNHLVLSGGLRARLVPAGKGPGEVILEVRF